MCTGAWVLWQGDGVAWLWSVGEGAAKGRALELAFEDCRAHRVRWSSGGGHKGAKNRKDKGVWTPAESGSWALISNSVWLERGVLSRVM